MIKLIILIIMVSFILFLYLKNKQENRNIDRHNRLVEKQEEMMKMLKEKKQTEDEN